MNKASRAGVTRLGGVIAALGCCAVLCGCAGQPLVKEAVGVRGIRDITGIPKGYATYTLFVSTSHDYARLEGTQALTSTLSRKFDRFGQAIGPRNYAAFVSDPMTGELDVSAGRTFLDRINAWYRFHNAYADGPFILVLQRHPTVKPDADVTAAVIALHGQDADGVSSILEELEQQLKAHKSSQPTPQTFATFWEAVRDGWNSGAGAGRSLVSVLVSAANDPHVDPAR